MKNNFLKIILAGAALCLVFSAATLASPKKANAQLAVVDAGNIAQNTISALENTVTAIETTDQEIESTVLNKIATAIAKELLMQITESVVNWINSGFNGNPSFIQNPTAFFENIGDQATGAFISQTGALSSLCSPFSLQVRLAIATQQQQNDGYGGNQYSCTLSTIIQNSINAANGASVSVQGFTGGDFSQGGWPAFSVLVTDPDNTPNGAYLDAENQLQIEINNQTTQKQNELAQGGGFLSWESCTPNPSSATTNTATGGNTSSANTTVSALPDDSDSLLGTDDSVFGGTDILPNSSPANTAASANTSSNNATVPSLPTDNSLLSNDDVVNSVVTGGVVTGDDTYNAAAENNPDETCSIQTPGSVISSALDKHLAVPTENLELADSINDIINAAFSELVVMALQKGLTSVSQSSNGGSSYLQSAINSANSQSVSNNQSSILSTISPYMTNAQEIYQNYSTALGLASTTNSTINQATSCYQNLETAPATENYPSSVSYMQGQISTLQGLAAELTPIITALTTKTSSADSTVEQYQQIEDQTSDAQSLSDLNAPDQSISDLSSINGSGFVSTVDVQNSQTDAANYQSQIQQIQQQANTALQQCQDFSYSSYGDDTGESDSYIQ